MMVIKIHRCRISIGYRSELLMIFAVILKVSFLKKSLNCFVFSSLLVSYSSRGGMGIYMTSVV